MGRSRQDQGWFVHVRYDDVEGAQQYFDFLAQEDAYTDSHDKVVHDAPQAKDLATDEFLK